MKTLISLIVSCHISTLQAYERVILRLSGSVVVDRFNDYKNKRMYPFQLFLIVK